MIFRVRKIEPKERNEEELSLKFIPWWSQVQSEAQLVQSDGDTFLLKSSATAVQLWLWVVDYDGYQGEDNGR